MLHRFWLNIAAVFAGALLTTACSAEDGAPDYRYRLTVEVDTPEGLKTGSSVIEVDQSLYRSAADPGAGLSLSRRVRGEAVAVDLPGGETLYALLRSENDIEWAGRVYILIEPCGGNGPACGENIPDLTGERTLPRMWRANVLQDERSAYPMMVRFADESDPTSVALVDPDDLAASFGEGVSLRRITVELTDDPVTASLGERLPWLEEAWSHDVNDDGPFYEKYPTILLGLRGV